MFKSRFADALTTMGIKKMILLTPYKSNKAVIDYLTASGFTVVRDKAMQLDAKDFGNVTPKQWAQMAKELDGPDVARRGDRHRNDEVAEHVAGSRPALSGVEGLQLVRLGRQHEIGSAKLPSAGKRRRFGRVGRVPLGRAALDPLRDQGDLIVAEPPLAGELAVSWLGQPRRHRAALHR